MITSQVRRVIIAGVIIGLFCLASVYAAPDKDSSNTTANEGKSSIQKPQPVPLETATKEEITRLINNLSSDDIAVRDKATEELKKIGSPALPFLDEASKNNDPEVAWRAKIIIKAINRAEQKKQQGEDESPESLPKKIGPTLRQFSNRFSITINNASPGTKSFALSQDSSGKVTVTTTEYDKDGKQTGKTYTADSLDEFKNKYPEIAKEYGIGENPPPSFEIPDFDMEDIWKDFGNAWGRRWDDLRKQIERLRDLLKQHNKDIPEGELAPNKPAIPPAQPEAPANLGIGIENLNDSSPPEADLPKAQGSNKKTASERQKFNVENGVLVTAVEVNSLGEKMGLKQDDVIISVNDSQVKTIWECRRLIKTAIENNKVQITVVRNGKKETLVYPK
ncbi:MAG: PDZ domain-containing protein [Planctomycetota bacterium]